jgi:HK97 family phage major capsid protein
MKFPEYDEVKGKLDAVQTKIASAMSEARSGGEGTIDLKSVTSIDGDSAAKAAQLKAWNDEAGDLAQRKADLAVTLGLAESQTKANAAQAGVDIDDRPASGLSFGQQFVKSAAFKNKGSKSELDVALKADFSRSAGWSPESTRSGLVVLDAQRPVQVTDLFPSIPTSQAAYKYMEETTFTNNAAERAEGAAYAEAALALTERSATIESIGVFIPVTDEQLEDEEGAAAYLDMRLGFMVSQRLDSQLLTGDGSTPNIRGVNNASDIQTQAKSSDTVPDAIHKAVTKVKVTGRAFPNAVVMHPNDWQDVRLLRTADGIYIWGSPSDAVAPTIWGLRVVESDAQTENTAVVGDFANYSLLVQRRGIEVLVSNSHASYFTTGKQAVRAGIRVASVFTRGAAFCTVTGI